MTKVEYSTLVRAVRGIFVLCASLMGSMAILATEGMPQPEVWLFCVLASIVPSAGYYVVAHHTRLFGVPASSGGGGAGEAAPSAPPSPRQQARDNVSNIMDSMSDKVKWGDLWKEVVSKNRIGVPVSISRRSMNRYMSERTYPDFVERLTKCGYIQDSGDSKMFTPLLYSELAKLGFGGDTRGRVRGVTGDTSNGSVGTAEVGVRNLTA